MNRGMIAAGAAAALALVGVPAASVGAAAAPTPGLAKATAKAAAKVAPSKWGSYVVVMKDDPLTATLAQDALGSAAALQRKAALEASHDAVVRRAGLASGRKVQDYTAVLNGFSVLASRSQAQRLAADPAVLRVTPDELRQKTSLAMDAGDDEIKAGAGQTLQQFLGVDSTSTKGDGELLGVIDTGVWPEHPSFADDGTYHPVQLNAKAGSNKCDFGNKKANPDDANWSCNKKLVGARQMLGTYRAVIGVLPGEFDSARDDEGHGTHTASTAAGNANVRAWTYDVKRTLDTTSGIAPRAQIVAYKALGSLGGFSSDLAGAIDQAVYDGVDVINYSIGGGPGLTSPDALSFLFANRAGIHVATSAGNDGPGESTIGGPADLPWVTTVGASTQPRFYAGTVVLGNGTRVLGSSVTLDSAADLPLVDAEALGNPLCLSKEQLEDDTTYAAFAAGAKGALVLCWRGEIGRSEKSLHVLQAGGKAMVLSNQSDDDNYFTDNFRVPTVMVDATEGEVIADYATTAGATATIRDTGSIRTFAPAPSMALFSSRGPNPSAGSIIKPDITAPGVQVLAGASPKPVGEDFEPGQLFQAIAGTSMSSPVMAGVFLLLDQLHPTWSPAMVKSATMTTASQDVLDNDRTTDADPFDFGAGHVDPVSAFNPGLVYNAGFNDFLGFYCGSDARNDVFVDADATCGSLEAANVPTTIEGLNYPTIGVDALAGVATVQRKVTNVLGQGTTFTASTQAPPGLSVQVTPAQLTLAPGATGTFRVTITNVNAPVNDTWRFGSLTWSGGGASVRSNIAVFPTAVSAPSLVTGTGASGSVAIKVTTGYVGEYTPVAGGLAANAPLTGNVSQDPDQTFAGCTAGQPGTTAAPVPVAADTAYLRLSQVLATDDDIDLYLCDAAGDVVAQSTAGGTNELIELDHPAAGEYTLYVHGWQVVAPPLAFSIDRWQVVLGQGAPVLSVQPATAAATIGGTVDVTASWSGAAAGTSFGVVDHTKDGSSVGLTVVQVTN